MYKKLELQEEKKEEKEQKIYIAYLINEKYTIYIHAIWEKPVSSHSVINHHLY